MKFPPKVGLLHSYRGERVNYQLLIGEAADNSLDAGAHRIDITIHDDQNIVFKDDGVGITRNRIESLFSIGDHGSMATTQLGRFGIGIKVQAINAGDIFAVKSTSKDGSFWVQVDWRQVLKSGQWESDDPIWSPVAVGAPTGTTIEISKLRPPGRYTVSKIVEELAQRFHPALSGGCLITLNGQHVPAFSDPKISDVVERDIALSGGRSAKIKGGILRETSKLWGVQVGFRHRIILIKDNLGCADYGGLTKMFARVQLSGPWRLGRFKDDLPDEREREELETAVEEVLRPILEKCNAASMDAKIAALGEMINEGLSADIAAARPHRPKPREPDPDPGPKRPRKPGVIDPSKAETNNGGPAKTKRPQQGRLLILLEGKNEENGIGLYKPGKPNRVYLSLDNPIIDKLTQYRDQKFAADALRTIALAIYVQGRRDAGSGLSGQTEFSFKPFGIQIADLLALNTAPIESSQTG